MDKQSKIWLSDSKKLEIKNSTVENQTVGSRKSEIGQSEINILELLPQRQPFVMIDRLLHFDSHVTKTSLTVHDDSIFVENGILAEVGVMENIAQTCAARMGYINKYLHSDSVKIGFIGSIKNLVIRELPRVDDELKTTVEVVNEVFSITLVNAKVEVADKLIASCEMKISITDMESHENN